MIIQNVWCRTSNPFAGPSYFPDSLSLQLKLTCHALSVVVKGCNVCKKTGWIEILGAGSGSPTSA